MRKYTCVMLHHLGSLPFNTIVKANSERDARYHAMRAFPECFLLEVKLALVVVKQEFIDNVIYVDFKAKKRVA